jgi:surface protein with Ig-like domain
MRATALKVFVATLLAASMVVGIKAMLAASVAAGATESRDDNGTPSGQPAPGGAGASTTSSTTSDKPGAPQLQVNGANPATIAVGTIYADLGAQITGPQADLNLGIHTFVDRVGIDPVAIDTSAPSSHTIEYVVSDSAGLTSTSTRTVIVSAPANDNIASSTPEAANDNAPLPELQATGTDSTNTATSSAQ